MIAETPEEQRLDFHLRNWQAWMGKGESVQGFKHQAAGCVGGGYFGDFEDMVSAVDRRTAAIMNTLINDLPILEHRAVHHVWLRTKWEYGNRALETAIRNYEELLTSGMDRKGLW